MTRWELQWSSWEADEQEVILELELRDQLDDALKECEPGQSNRLRPPYAPPAAL
jgi:hypothetical protein